METLFSTVAQISFTIVGLFFVALTVDSDARKFWFGQKPQSRYAYLNLLVMLFPGILALGGMVSMDEGVFPSWPISAMLVCILSTWIYLRFKEIEKSLGYEAIYQYETILETPKLISWYSGFLLFLSIFGVLANLNGASDNFRETMNIFAGIFLFFSVGVSIVPINVFLRIYTENQKDETVKKKNNKKTRKIPSK